MKRTTLAAVLLLLTVWSGVLAKPASAALSPGWHTIDRNWSVLCLRSDQAHQFADVLGRTSDLRSGLGGIAAAIAFFAPAAPAWVLATALIVAGAGMVAYSIHWCADRAPYVYILVWRGSVFAGCARAW